MRTLATRYAKGPDSADNVGHAVVSALSSDIGRIAHLEAETLRERPSGLDSSELSIKIMDFERKFEREFREQVWRSAVQTVVDARAAGASR